MCVCVCVCNITQNTSQQFKSNKLNLKFIFKR